MRTLIAPGLLALALAACQPAPEAAPADAAAPPAAPVAPAEPVAPEAPATPRLVVETLDDGTFDLAAERGGWVVVNFWATWCKPCLKEIPDLSAFDAERDDVRVIGLAYEEIDADAMRAFLEKHPAGYPIALLDVYDPPADFETPRGLPMTYLIDPEGKVAKKYLGPITSQMLAADIAAAGGAG
jgi:thiol-disulfide isomerase/thioredoxin